MTARSDARTYGRDRGETSSELSRLSHRLTGRARTRADGLDIQWTLTCGYGFWRTDWTSGIDLRIKCFGELVTRFAILRYMVLFEREIRLWRETNATQRALMIRDDADFAWLAVEMQHDRVVNGAHPSPSNDVRLHLFRQKADVDFFFMALYRVVVTAELTQEVADPRRVMPDAMRTFSQETAGMMLSEADEPATVASVRHALEHGQNLERRGGLGFGRGEEGWYVSYRDRTFDTSQLLAAGRKLHRAVREAVDSEAFADSRGQYPIAELRDPAVLSLRQRWLRANRANGVPGN